MNYDITSSNIEEDSRSDAGAVTLRAEDKSATPVGDSAPQIPAYLRDTYTWAYLDPRGVKALDHEFVVKTILWRQHRRLEKVTFCEIEAGSTVLQTACVYGDFSAALARHIGPEGSLQIVDVAKIQVDNCARKLRDYPFANVRHFDVLDLADGEYDAVCCYFLMHEMPDDIKRRLVDVVLSRMAPGGKAVFVDYHKPHWANPAKLVTSLVFDFLEPYAKGLWHQPIRDFARDSEKFSWRKETFFGGLFQKVVATYTERDRSWKP